MLRRSPLPLLLQRWPDVPRKPAQRRRRPQLVQAPRLPQQQL